MALLTFEQQNTYKKITSNNQSDYIELERETEEHDLEKLLGAAFLQDIQDNPDTTENLTLLDGGSYEDCDGNTVKHKGLRYVLAFMVYSNYIGKSGIKDTATGLKIQASNNSEKISSGERKSLKERYQSIAMTQWLKVKDFLDENKDLYPLWNEANEKKVFTPIIKPIRKTVYPNSRRNNN